jgi:hypothetical protein
VTRFSLPKLVVSAAVLVTAIVFSVSAAGATYAYLTASTQVVLVSSGETTATITAGTATLTVNADAISLTGLYPGDVRRAPVTVTNTGTTALALSVDSIVGTSTTNGLTASVAAGACPGTGTAVASGPIGVTVAPGASTVVCLAVGMALTAPSAAQSVSSTITANILGVQP